MKKLIAVILCSFFAINAIADSPKLQKDFYKEFGDFYIVEGNSLCVKKIFDFPGQSQADLENAIKTYSDGRILHRQSQSLTSNSDVIYEDGALIISEKSTPLKINFLFYTGIYYLLRLQCKDERIRVTIFLSSVDWGGNFSDLPISAFYPFKKIGGGKKALKGFEKYVNSEILDPFPETINSILNKSYKSDSDW